MLLNLASLCVGAEKANDDEVYDDYWVVLSCKVALVI